jgi:hypothetical protein
MVNRARKASGSFSMPLSLPRTLLDIAVPYVSTDTPTNTALCVDPERVAAPAAAPAAAVPMSFAVLTSSFRRGYPFVPVIFW